MKKVIRHKFWIFTIIAFVFLENTVSAQNTTKADTKFNNSEYSQALQLYKKMLVSPDKMSISAKTNIYTKIVKCYMALGYYSPARQWIEKVMKINPDYMANYLLYADILRNNGCYMDALSYYYRYSCCSL